MTYKHANTNDWGNKEKVFIVGKVVEEGDGFFVIEDFFGKAKIKSNFKVKVGETIRAFCHIENNELVSDFIQNLDGLDLKLFNKASSLYETI